MFPISYGQTAHKQILQEILELKSSGRMINDSEAERLRMLNAQLFVMKYCKGVK